VPPPAGGLTGCVVLVIHALTGVANSVAPRKAGLQGGEEIGVIHARGNLCGAPRRTGGSARRF
jgi:hypothetical protein